ncbi:HNH endonuclease, partial [Xanthomonas citri pv. citri]|nr:HNH endonuclease [Xanthomonas citri pv. citri]
MAGLEQLEVEGLPDLSKVDGAPEVRHRVEKQYRLVAQRGAAARSFAKKVLLAYNGVCVICGEYLAGGPGVSSGIE